MVPHFRDNSLSAVMRMTHLVGIVMSPHPWRGIPIASPSEMWGTITLQSLSSRKSQPTDLQVRRLAGAPPLSSGCQVGEQPYESAHSTSTRRIHYLLPRLQRFPRGDFFRRFNPDAKALLNILGVSLRARKLASMVATRSDVRGQSFCFSICAPS